MKQVFLFLIFSVCTVLFPACLKEGSDLVDLAFEPAPCSAASERSLDDSYYSGPMIDTHIHVPGLPDGPFQGILQSERPLMGVNVFIEDYICMMDAEGTSKVFAFFPVWEPITDELLELVSRTMEAYPDRFVPFIMPPYKDDLPEGFPTVDAETLEEMLSVYPGLFEGYGEIGLYARGDHGGPTGAPELPPSSERLLEIYPLVRENDLLVYFHLGAGQKEAFEEVLDANPDINFIWHGDQLISGSGVQQDLSVVDEILTNHSNVYYGVDELYGDTWMLKPEVSKEEFLAYFENPEPLLEQDWVTWKAFIEKHSDQVLWGTDRGWSSPWSLDPEVALTLNTYARAFIAGLDPDVQEKYAYKNAENLLSTD